MAGKRAVMEVSVHVDTDVYMYTVLQTYISFSVLDLLKLTDVLSFLLERMKYLLAVFSKSQYFLLMTRVCFPLQAHVHYI